MTCAAKSRGSSTTAASKRPLETAILAAFNVPKTPEQWLLLLFGFSAQFVFFLRFVVQWYASERRKRSHVPIAFWYLSIAGGLMLLVYAILIGDIVISAGQLLSLAIYVRNLMLIYARRGRVAARAESRPS